MRFILRKILQYCENKPEVVVDKAPWYHWALQRLGFKYRNETFSERISKASSLNLKKELKDSGIDSHLIALLIQS